jgi:glycosyltransferase involved in cell wall biosynthesis
MRLGVTVVVCTYNGAALIPDTLAHIAQQRVTAGVPWEVIVVDNASSDNTSAVVQDVWQKHNSFIPFKLLYQSQQGLTFARTMALEEAEYEFVVFCDDDNWLNPHYVNTVYNLMLQHSSIGVLGGLGELVYEEKPPDWTLAFGMFGNGPQEKTSGKVRRNTVYGAGCVLRRSAFLKIIRSGYQPLLTDRFAKNLSSGGDYEFCYVLALAGYDIWYDERLRFKHYMPKERIEWRYYERFFTESAQALKVLVPYRFILNYGIQNTSQFYLKLLRLLLFNVKQLNLLLLRRLRLPSGSAAAKVNTLKLMRVKATIANLRKYRVMKSNFVHILNFQKHYLASFTKNETNSVSDRIHIKESLIGAGLDKHKNRDLA